MDARFGNLTLHNGGTLTSNRGLGAWDALFAEVNDGGNTVAATLAVTGAGVATMNGTGGIHLGGVQNFSIADTSGNPDADLVVNMILDKRGNNPGSAGGINKLGAGTMRINSNSSYDGATIVTEGALIVAGSLTATSSVTVASGATLGGNGNLGGPVTIQSGGTHALEVAAEPGQQATRTITGTLTLDSGNILRLTAAAAPANGTYILAVASGGITGTPGTVHLPEGVSGTVAVNGNNLELTVGAASDYDTWAGPSGFNLAGGPNDDDDKDGLTNFEEYAFGLNPTSGSSVSPVTAPNKTTGTFTYTRRKQSLTGLTYTYQSSATLAGWANFTPPVPDVSNNGDPVETITVTIPAALLGGDKLFLRVAAQKP
jgi:autotransporter-associated beta strand protein